MISLIRAERKRIVSNKALLIIMAVVTIFSLAKSLGALEKYNVYDSYGNVLISAEENIKESKKPEHNILLDEDAIARLAAGGDKTRYLYHSNAIALVAANYNRKMEDLTPENIHNFYKQRWLNVRENLGGTAQLADIDQLMAEAMRLPTPIQLGYAEGWKTLNNDFIDFATILVYLVPFLVLSLFGSNPKVKTEQLCGCTRYGQKKRIACGIQTAFCLGAFIYLVSVLIFSACHWAVLGFEGANLPIQGSMLYFFCPYSLTFGEQYLINVGIGLLALALMIGITLFLTVLFRWILSSAIVLTLFLAIMPMLPNNNFDFNFYLGNFLPYSMTNFNSYIIKPYIYSFAGRVIPAFAVVIFVSSLACLLLVCFIYALLRLSRGYGRKRAAKRPCYGGVKGTGK